MEFGVIPYNPTYLGREWRHGQRFGVSVLTDSAVIGRRRKDAVMAGAKQYDAVKGEWVAATKEQEAHHEAVAEGKPLPSDRTEADMRRLEPGMAGAGPVLTTNENTVDLDRAGTGGGTAGARTR